MYFLPRIEFIKEYFALEFSYLWRPVNRDEFFKIVSMCFPKNSEGYILIWRAYNDSKDAFRDQFRSTGERTFEHSKALALILMLHLNVRDANIIAAALLHDCPEDKAEWSEERIHVEYNKAISELVAGVTKLDRKADFDGDDFLWAVAMHARQDVMSHGSWQIKLADVLHNFLTCFPPCDEKKRTKKMDQVRWHYIHQAAKHDNLLFKDLMWLFHLHRTEPAFTGFRVAAESALPFGIKP